MTLAGEVKLPRGHRRGPERITAQIAVETWGRRALIDLYLSLGEVEMISVVAHLSLLAQGLEKLGKAYLIGTQAGRFEHLPAEEATRWIDRYARWHDHRLSDILGSAGIGLPPLRNWLRDPVIEILEDAMEQGRYPAPVEKSVFSKWGIGAVVTHRNRDKALAIASQLVDGIRAVFGVDLMSSEKPPFDGVAVKDWTNFLDRWRRATKE